MTYPVSASRSWQRQNRRPERTPAKSNLYSKVFLRGSTQWPPFTTRMATASWTGIRWVYPPRAGASPTTPRAMPVHPISIRQHLTSTAKQIRQSVSLSTTELSPFNHCDGNTETTMKTQALAQIPDPQPLKGPVARLSNVVKTYKTGDVEV